MIVIRASVNYAKDGLDQLFLFPGLVNSSVKELSTLGGIRRWRAHCPAEPSKKRLAFRIVLSGLEKDFTYGCDHWAVNNHIPVY